MKKKKTSKIDPRARFLGFVLFLALLGAGVNFAYQLYRKPAEILNFFGLGKAKTLKQTWEAYQHYFEYYAIDFVSPYFLAALAQVESAGNPLATPAWRFKLSQDWSRMYSPASTSVGLYQMTDPTFARARRYCVRSGKIFEVGRWDDFNSCWFNWTYSRISPRDSIQIVSAQLYSETREILGSSFERVPAQKRRELASIIHLCGKSKGVEFVRKGFNLDRLGYCYDYNPRAYVQRVEYYQAALGRR